MEKNLPSWKFNWFLGTLYLVLIGGLTIDLFFAKLYGQWLFIITTIWLYLAGDVIGSLFGTVFKRLGSSYGLLVRFVIITGAIVAGANASNYFQGAILDFIGSFVPGLKGPVVAVLSFFGPMLLFVDLYVHSDEFKKQRKPGLPLALALGRYTYPILIAIIIAFFFFILPLTTSYLAPYSGLFNSLGGLLFAADIAFFWGIYQAPVLVIGGIERVRFNIPGPSRSRLSWEYSANRIIIRNVGRSAARNCKGWISMGERKERVAWVVRDEPNITINQRDTERLNFCAYFVSGQRPVTINSEARIVPWVIRPTENGWSDSPWNDEISAESPVDRIRADVIVTSDNADPVQKAVYFTPIELSFESR